MAIDEMGVVTVDIMKMRSRQGGILGLDGRDNIPWCGIYVVTRINCGRDVMIRSDGL